LISNDLWTGKIIDKVGELGLADKTEFYITSDHDRFHSAFLGNALRRGNRVTHPTSTSLAVISLYKINRYVLAISYVSGGYFSAVEESGRFFKVK
jgi:hypothetical protein